MTSLRLLALFTFALSTLLGCGTTRQSSEQLARVAKDWCLTIRASQVIPIYPLSEDVEVGDVYLVRTRIEDQIAVYQAEGFLPLENLAARIPPTGYVTFYKDGYRVTAKGLPPRVWQFPPEGSTTQPTDYRNAPRAAFPAYTFQVRRGEGLSLAVPVQGVPVGLSLLNTASASGAILITDAVTYGVDMASLQVQVQQWAEKNREFLKQFAPADDQAPRHYLRVVSRVYLAGRVAISLLNDQARGAGVDAGDAQPVDLNIASRIEAVNKALASAVDFAPGGSLRLTSASARSVSLDETFPRPLVIGYIGFDLPILENGEIGPPVPTQQRLLGRKSLPARAVKFGADANTQRIARWLDADPQNLNQLRDYLKQHDLEHIGVTNVVQGAEFRDQRARIVQHFRIPE